MKLEVKLPKTEAEQRDHLDKCNEKRCFVCYFCQNQRISEVIHNLVVEN